MKKLSLLLGVAALVLAATVMMGCENATEEKTITVNAGFDGTVVKSEDDLVTAIALAGTGSKTFAYIGTALGTTLTVTEIPANVTVNLYNNVTLAGTLTVKGTVNVMKGAKLTADTSGPKLLQIGDATVDNGAGTVNVKAGGTLDLDTGLGAVKFAPASKNNAYVALTEAKVIAAISSGVVKGASASSNAVLNLEKDAILDNVVPVAATTDTVKSLANGRFGLNLSSTTVAGVADLTIREGTSYVPTGGAFAPTGTLTVNGTLSTASDSSSVINAELTKVVVGPKGSLTASQTGDTFAAVTSLKVDGTLTAPYGTFAVLTNAPTGSGSIIIAAPAVAKAPLFIESAVASVTYGGTTITDDELTIPANKVRTFTGVAAPSGKVTVNGGLVLNNGLTLVDELKINNAAAYVALATSKAITLGHASAKISGSTYNFTPESGKTDGTLTAGVTSTAVAFGYNAIAGYTAPGAALTTTAATLTFGTSDSVLAVSGDTTVTGVILDVSSKGKISIANGKVLTLAYAGTSGAASGGIFTKAGGITTVNAVKANAVEDTTALSPDTAATLAEATISTSAGSTSAVKAATPASGTITGGSSGTDIDKNDTFAVSAAVITPTGV
ncbi:MAG: hypothetical protein LBR23_08020 [Spirochaetaceae bacterium]|jgi:hypothetical protein|nr:hypothetical protein [Spirochaetaceae bacterium]